MALHEMQGALRYADLRRRVSAISPKELAKHLRRFESAGLINRRVYPTVPPRVEYSLTDMGRGMYPSLEALAGWAARYGR